MPQTGGSGHRPAGSARARMDQRDSARDGRMDCAANCCQPIRGRQSAVLVCGRDGAKGGRSFVGTCAMYENECRARQTQRGTKLILCDSASFRKCRTYSHHADIAHLDRTAWLGWEDSNLEMSWQNIPLKGSTDFQRSSLISAAEIIRVRAATVGGAARA